MSERQACKLVGMDRSSYRDEPRSDRNGQLREELLVLARQKPRYGYRRLHALLERKGYKASAQRVYRLYNREGLAVRRLKRKRLTRVPVSSRLLVRANQRWRWTSYRMRSRQDVGFASSRWLMRSPASVWRWRPTRVCAAAGPRACWSRSSRHEYAAIDHLRQRP
jgi:hypothetical protein